jgi:hypothetical protein
MVEFKRGIRNDKFIKALERLSRIDGWWRDVLLDKSLIIAVRDESLNVYWRGQSIFYVVMQNDDTVVATTHSKYLLNPDLSKQVSFDGNSFAIGPIEATALIRTYEPGKTLNKLKRAADLFSGDEKRGVHDIVTSNDNIVDVEITMRGSGVLDAGLLPRADIAAFDEDKRGIRLVLWEAKTFYNKELRLTGKKNVVNQIKKYKDVVTALRPSIIKSYKCVAKNLIAIADMSGGHRKYNESIRKVAKGAELVIREPADVGLIVFGYDAAQLKHVWKDFSVALGKAIEPSQLKTAGDVKNLTI